MEFLAFNFNIKIKMMTTITAIILKARDYIFTQLKALIIENFVKY